MRELTQRELNLRFSAKIIALEAKCECLAKQVEALAEDRVSRDEWKAGRKFDDDYGRQYTRTSTKFLATCLGYKMDVPEPESKKVVWVKKPVGDGDKVVSA